MTVGGEVEGVVLVVVAADHRLDAAGLVVEDDHRGGGRDARQRALRDLLRGVLHLYIERGVNGEAAAESPPRAIEIDDLLAQPRGEVGSLGIDARLGDLGWSRELGLDALVVLRPRY